MNFLEHFSPGQIISALENFVTEERKQKLDQVLSRRSLQLVPVLEGLYDRGNVSAVMRSAEAFGFYKFHIVEILDKFKESQRVTQGADKWLEVKRWQSTGNCIEHLRKQGYTICSTHLSQKSVPMEELDFSKKVALVFGNEKEGVTQEALELSDHNVLLPMVGFTQSFNISVAAALSFQMFFLSNPEPTSEKERQRLKALYFLRTLNWPEAALLKHLNGAG